MRKFPPKLQIPGLNQTGLMEYLAAQPDIIAVYLFGSSASGETRPDSDIDLAILLDQTSRSGDESDILARFDREMTLTGSMETFVHGRKLDVLFLDAAPIQLRFQVLSTGFLLYENESRRLDRIEFEVTTVKRYFDLKPLLDFSRRMLLLDIQEGRFGERRRHHQRTLTAIG